LQFKIFSVKNLFFNVLFVIDFLRYGGCFICPSDCSTS